MIAFRKMAKLAYAAFPEIRWQYPPYDHKIYLTFDDGPYPPVTAPLLEMLGDLNIPATFFLSGDSIYRYRHQLAGLDYSNHQVGSHSFFHVPHFGLKGRQVLRQINCTDELIMRYTGKLAQIYRPPYGIFSGRHFPLLKSASKQMVLWSLMAYDFKWPAEKILDYLYANIQAGDIVVFHDSPLTEKVLLKVLPPFIDHCRQRGWRFEAISSAAPH